MKLIEFYRQLFLETSAIFEPVWEGEDIPFGYRWHKRNYPLPEQFQIRDMNTDHPALMYSLILPETYLGTTIYEEIKRYPSEYELSIVILNRQIWLNATLQTDKLQDSLMGFLHHSRGELMNVLDCIIRLPEEAKG
ncbi:hypothetical protein J4772_27215 [Cohnella sp. LGH]|uniref:hypothetical protein n=1 Tax=Cohnella sp. LGH TaxID=1619153 RepID=UPI001ADAD064|nr:hypothetical protein [Cohnella sp. LGH]QTH41212.1 hypothetical protein J4772_27215 [Cohnella sp. LGH]